MARQIIAYSSGHDLRRQLIGADPGPLRTLSVPLARGQGTLEAGCLVDSAGQRAVIASQVEGVLAAPVNTDFPDPPNDLSGRIAVYTGGRFLWPAVRRANPAFVFDQVSVDVLKSKGITFEAVASGSPTGWISRP